MRIAGILLAAGRGSRFSPDGGCNKLLQPLATGASVLAASARHMLAALPEVVAVVRSGDEATAAELSALGCMVTECPDAHQGMACSLVHGLRQAGYADGWVLALGDMPHVQPATIAALARALEEGADIAAPVHDGKRGNPVAFSRLHLPALLALQGDEGARGIVRNSAVQEVPVDDPGIFRDIDTPADLR
ncbi:nucleotidyltransferase family protein [Massilia endophytica]|nr:nucleotidyltransferase family protein [Massilia endophytica]